MSEETKARERDGKIDVDDADDQDGLLVPAAPEDAGEWFRGRARDILDGHGVISLATMGRNGREDLERALFELADLGIHYNDEVRSDAMATAHAEMPCPVGELEQTRRIDREIQRRFASKARDILDGHGVISLAEMGRNGRDDLERALGELRGAARGCFRAINPMGGPRMRLEEEGGDGDG